MIKSPVTVRSARITSQPRQRFQASGLLKFLQFILALNLSVALLNAQNAAAPPEQEKPELVLQTGQTTPAQTIAFSPDGKLLASGSSAEVAIRVWETASGRQLALLTRRSFSAGTIVAGVTALAFSRDGVLLAAGFGDNSVSIWAVISGEEVAAIPGSERGYGVFEILFSPDGKYLLTQSEGSTVWDLSTGTPVREIKGTYSRCRTAAFSSNGQGIVNIESSRGSSHMVIGRNGTASIRSNVVFTDIASGRNTRTVDLSDSISPATGGTCVLTTTEDHVLVATGSLAEEVKIWDVTSGSSPRVLPHPIPNLSYVSLKMQTLSGNGRLAAFAQRNNFSVWDLGAPQSLFTTAIEKNPLFEMANEVAALEFSADGKFLAVGTNDGKIRIFDSTGHLMRKLEGTVTPSLNVSFDSAHGRLYSGQKTVWNLESGRGEQILAGVQDAMGVLGPRGSVLAEPLTNGDVRIRDVPTSAQISTLSAGVSAAVDKIVFSTSGRIAAVSYKPALITAANSAAAATSLVQPALRPPIQNGKNNKRSASDAIMQQMQAAQAMVTALQSSDPAAHVRIFDVPSGKLIAAVPVGGTGRGYMTKIDISPDEQSLAVATGAGIEIWTIANQGKRMVLAPPAATGAGTLFQQASNYARQIQSLHYSPDGKFIAASLRDTSASTAALLQAATSRLSAITDSKHHRSKLGGLFPQFPRTGKPSNSSSADGVKNFSNYKVDGPVEIWDTTKAEKVLTLPGHQNGAGALAYSPDGKLLATTGVDDDVKIWDLASGEELRTLTGQTATVNDLAFDASNTLLATACADGTTRLWDLRTGEFLATLLSLYDGREWLVVTPDGLFDGSSGAWNQILWRFGGTIFDVLPVESFFVEYYYPDLLADIVAGKPPHAKQDISKKDRRQPRVTVEAVGAADVEAVSARTLTVNVTVDSAPGGARDLRLFRNGSLVKAWRGDVLKGKSSVILQTTVSVSAGVNAFTAYAFNRDNVKSSDTALMVEGSVKLQRRGTAHVLAIGINRYANPAYNLAYAVADAREFADQLSSHQAHLGSFSGMDVTLLLDQDATKANILLALDRLAGRGTLPPDSLPSLEKIKPAEPEDAVFIYFAGHGTASGQHFFFIPHDLGYEGVRTELHETELKAVLAHSISDGDLEPVLEAIDAGHLILVVDSCHSGQALESEEKRRGPINVSGLAQLAYEKGMYILTAAEGYQAAAEVSKLGHGLLTYALVEEGMKTAAADTAPRDGQVTVREWFDYATLRVPELQMQAMEDAHKAGRELSLVDEEQGVPEPKKRSLQHPRAYYRRDPESHLLIISKLAHNP